MRYLTAGESHGPSLTTIIDGIPANMPLQAAAINDMLARRQGGYGRGGRMKIETDRVDITSGVRHGYTLGSPITLVINNKDWENWRDIMAVEVTNDGNKKTITRPRPGHADLPGGMKYRQRDLRNILERSSARETAARVAAGSVAKQFLNSLGVEILSHVVRIGGVKVERDLTWEELQGSRESPVYCADTVAAQEMVAAIEEAKAQGDTLGGVFEVRVRGLLPGIGSHVQWDRRLDGRLAQSVMSIQAIKGVEIGFGFRAGELSGSQVHDEIHYDEEKGYYRATNRAGGLEGGMTNGEELVIRAVMKPIPTLMQPLRSVNIATRQTERADVERADVCAVPAASVVGEAAVAFTLAQAILEQFGGDSMDVITKRWEEWKEYVREF
ncbi:MAG: chorismate synthase [Thermoanaerobacteraceae bacterium]|nr:chorismate synthase [Thermoanaerobacteraceae bacterium]